ncbi:hypothetical protein VTO42DRAFT_7114 [Malbranchea cinnamomea]
MDYGYGGNQYTTTSYGGGGGGFTVGDNASSSQSFGSKNQSLRPVTIKQLNDATQAYPDADFKIDDAEVNTVTFVGQVRNISNLTTFVTYKLDDGTGEIEVKFWPGDKEEVPDVDSMDTGATDRPKKNEIKVNGYAKVTGSLKTFNNRRSVTAFVVKPITDMNEFHCHFLEATAVHLYFTRVSPPHKRQGAESGAVSGNAGTAGGTATGTTHVGKPLPSMSAMARKLYQVMCNAPPSHEGMHVQRLATEMGVPVNEVLKAGEELINLGQIYTTVDDNTWAILDI